MDVGNIRFLGGGKLSGFVIREGVENAAYSGNNLSDPTAFRPSARAH
jgi:hypothetical protein